jgi:hypothetical protein
MRLYLGNVKTMPEVSLFFRIFAAVADCPSGPISALSRETGPGKSFKGTR